MGRNLCVACVYLALTSPCLLTSSRLRVAQIFIADRSPFSAVYYAAHGHLLEPIIREQMKEVMADAGVEMMTVYIQVECVCACLVAGLPRTRLFFAPSSFAAHALCSQVEKETLWSRIQERLSREPSRAQYKEVCCALHFVFFAACSIHAV